MELIIIVAADENNGIGINGKLPWHLPNDLKFFKNTTWAMPILMGRKTYDSIGKPLQGRNNIVLTHNPQTNNEPDLYFITNIQQGIEVAESLSVKQLFIIGGATIFNETLPIVDKILLTQVKANLEADTYFPAIDETKFKLVNQQYIEADTKNKYDQIYETWVRI